MSVGISGGSTIIELEAIQQNLIKQVELLKNLVKELQIANSYNEAIVGERLTENDIHGE